MPKKIYDIKPPKVARKSEKVTKESLGDIKIKRKPTVRHKKESRNHSIFWPVFIAILVVVIAVGIFLFFKLQKAEITIWPKVDTLSFQQTITAEKTIDTMDAVKAVVPAQYFEASKTESQDFPATGSASDGGKANGTITIYNKYSPVMPFTFKTGTHFMSDSGKLFVALQKISIPAAKKSGSKIIPGSVQVKVQAVEAGDGYNISASNFSIPGLKGTAYYYGVYATSTEAMTGGYTGKVKKVTDDDIQGAKDVLTKKTTEDVIVDLKGKISSDYVLLDNAISSTVTDASTKIKVGAVADNFSYNATVKATALVFKKSDLDGYAKQYILSQIPEGKVLLDKSYKIDYSATSVDISGGKATLVLNFSSGIYQSIDTNSLALSLLGKDKDQINGTINENIGEQVSKTQVKLWPFWATKAPKNQKVVTVELKF